MGGGNGCRIVMSTVTVQELRAWVGLVVGKGSRAGALAVVTPCTTGMTEEGSRKEGCY